MLYLYWFTCWTACTNKFKDLSSQWCYLIYFLPEKTVPQYEILMYEILVLIENTNWRKFTLFNGQGSACIHFNLEQNSHKDILKCQSKKAEAIYFVYQFQWYKNQSHKFNQNIHIWTAFNAKYLKEDKISSKKVRISFMISV